MQVDGSKIPTSIGKLILGKKSRSSKYSRLWLGWKKATITTKH